MERWTSDIDGATFYMPSVPPDAGPVLAQAAEEHRRALAPAAPPQITHALMAMRSSTHRRNETANEAEASFRALVEALLDLPLDIVEEGCRLYVRSERFFPRAPAELLAFTNPLLTQRQRRATNLAQLARQAEINRKLKEELEKPVEPATDDDLRELARNPSVPRSIFATYVAKGWADQADVDRILAEADATPAVPDD